jgi:N-acetylmuramoyl-L-alanine amidase
MGWGPAAATLAALLTLTCTPVFAAQAPLLVILDPGHGGEDTGAIRNLNGRRIAEKELSLSLAQATARVLRAKGVPVFLTRTNDSFVGLDRRTELANKLAQRAKNAVFVSIHANSSGESRSTGIETYIFNATTNEASKRLADLENGRRWAQEHGTLDLILSDLSATANHGDSADLACAVQEATVEGMARTRKPTRNRGIRQALFYVLMQTRMPSILFEPGFVSNPSELERLASPAYQHQLALSLATGIMNWNARANAQTSGRALSAVRKPRCQIH